MLDTNLLISALVPEHPEHARSLPWLERARSAEVVAAVSVHSLAEFYSVLTGHLKARPSAVQQMIKADIIPYVQLITLNEAEYLALIAYATAADIRGGTLFDVIIGWAAWKADADLIVTLNTRHFHRLFPDRTEQIIGP